MFHVRAASDTRQCCPPLKYLKDDSLAAQLVRAHRAPDGTAPADAMKAVLEGRLRQVRKNLDGTED